MRSVVYAMIFGFALAFVVQYALDALHIHNWGEAMQLANQLVAEVQE